MSMYTCRNAVKCIGVLTSGGDAPGMNAAIRAVVLGAIYRGIKVIGIKRGWQGLIDGGSNVFEMKASDVRNIVSLGGTILNTSRSWAFRTYEGRHHAYKTCQQLGLDGIVAIGGNGTAAGALAFATEYPISAIFIPATVDNDLGATSKSIGFLTACNTGTFAIDKIKDTMQSHERCSVVEVVGHHSGHIALHIGIAVGATAIVIPKKELDFRNDIADKLISARRWGHTSFLVIVAEGAHRKAGRSLYNEEIGNGVAARFVASEIKEKLGYDPRVTVLGHIQRGGSPTSEERLLASRMGFFAVETLATGKTNRMIAERGGGITDIDLVEALKIKDALNEDQLHVAEILTFGFYSNQKK